MSSTLLNTNACNSRGQLIVMGLYFIFMRPALLPEDLNYMSSTMQNIKHVIPRLLNWIQKVF